MFFALLPGVKRFILGVTDAPELLVGRGRLGSIALADQLHDAFAAVNLLAEHRAQIALFSAEDVLPHRLVPEELQGIRNQLTRGFQLLADRGNENGGAP
jgi:hypothetical protein